VEQPWHADDGGAGGNFDEIRRFFHKLVEIGPNFDCSPEPPKSILQMRQPNLEADQKAFLDFRFKVTTGNHCCLGGFVGEDGAIGEWSRAKTKLWEESFADLVSAAPNFQQAAHSGLKKSLEQE
jgi:hypothetical protein